MNEYNTQTKIKKEQQEVDSLFNYETDKVESKGTIEVVGSGNLRYALLCYMSDLEESLRKDRPIVRDIDAVLTPQEIDTFLQSTRDYKDTKYYALRTGTNITELIRNSYTAMNNNFIIHAKNLPPLEDFARYLQGDSRDPLSIEYFGDLCDSPLTWGHINMHVHGNVSSYFSHYSNNVNAVIDGYAGYKFGERAINSNFTIKGEVDEGIGMRSINCTYTILGSTKANASFFKMFFFPSNDPSFSFMKESKVIVEDEKIYSQIKSVLKKRKIMFFLQQKIPEDQYNELILVDKNGTEQNSWRFS